MPTKRLTATNVQTLPCPAGKERVHYFDATKSAPPGFALRVTATARERSTGRWSGRSYVLKFYVRGTGARGWLVLGDVGDVTLDAARVDATEKSTLAANGRDPRFVAAVDKARTVAAVCTDYIEAVSATASPTTVDGYRRLLKHVVAAPELKAPVDSIEDAHVSALLARLGTAKGKYLANRVFALISAALRWARGTRRGKGARKIPAPTAEQRIARNPCAEMTAPNPEKKRERALADDELVRVWKGLDTMPPEAAAYVRFLILAGLRRNEAAALRWRDYNAGERLLTVPGEVRKGGRTHVVFLAPLAVDVLASIGPGKRDALIFGEGGRRFVTNEGRTMAAIRAATEVRVDNKVKVPQVEFRLHDLRRTCATGCAKTGADETMISRILGHAVFAKALPVTVQYIAHAYAAEHRAALERWAAYVEALLGIVRPEAKVLKGEFGKATA